MHSPGVGGELAIARQIQIGRLFIDIATAEGRPACGRERADSIGDPSYILAVPLAGSLNFSQNCRSGIAIAGEYVLLSQQAYYELSSEFGATLILVRIPAAELRGRLASVDDHVSRRFSANEHMTRLLVDLIRGVTDIFVDRPAPNPEALATEIVSFVALAIGAEDRGAAVDVRNARYHLRRRIFDFIEKHLGDQDLSPKKIAASSRISMSYLYSLFNDDDTTVGQFVQVKRLQRAYELLVADQKGHRTVSEIAYEVGFKNVSHFSRTFSRQFSMAPRDARRPARLADHGDQAKPITGTRQASVGARGRYDAPFLDGAFHLSLRDAM
jgi:AraC-like DNA-binding protein